ncbi:hypothetical protein Tco_0596885 [Tanacetum coccineum]
MKKVDGNRDDNSGESRRLAFLEIKRREVECREREIKQQDMRFYLQPYDHLTGDKRNAMEEMRAKIKANYNLPLNPGYGAASVSMACLPGVTTPGLANKQQAARSCPVPMGLLMLYAIVLCRGNRRLKGSPRQGVRGERKNIKGGALLGEWRPLNPGYGAASVSMACLPGVTTPGLANKQQAARSCPVPMGLLMLYAIVLCRGNRRLKGSPRQGVRGERKNIKGGALLGEWRPLNPGYGAASVSMACLPGVTTPGLANKQQAARSCPVPMGLLMLYAIVLCRGNRRLKGSPRQGVRGERKNIKGGALLGEWRPLNPGYGAASVSMACLPGVTTPGLANKQQAARSCPVPMGLLMLYAIVLCRGNRRLKGSPRQGVRGERKNIKGGALLGEWRPLNPGYGAASVSMACLPGVTTPGLANKQQAARSCPVPMGLLMLYAIVLCRGNRRLKGSPRQGVRGERKNIKGGALLGEWRPLNPGYGAASVSMACLPGVTTPGLANKQQAARSCPVPMGLLMLCSINAVLSILTCSS